MFASNAQVMAQQNYIQPPAASSQPITPKFVPANPRPSAVVPAIATNEPPPTAGQTIAPAAFVQPLPFLPQPRQLGPADDGSEILVSTDPPGPQRLFQRDSEATFFQRLSQSRIRTSGQRATFPDEPIISKDKFKPRTLTGQVVEVEPCYVVHGRLYFEQPNFERYGYDFGVLQPGISLAVFYYDTLLLPYHAYSDLRTNYECSAGNSLKCLPGDAAPFLWPRERFSVTGLVGQTSILMGGFYLLP